MSSPSLATANAFFSRHVEANAVDGDTGLACQLQPSLALTAVKIAAVNNRAFSSTQRLFGQSLTRCSGSKIVLVDASELFQNVVRVSEEMLLRAPETQ